MNTLRATLMFITVAAAWIRGSDIISMMKVCSHPKAQNDILTDCNDQTVGVNGDIKAVNREFLISMLSNRHPSNRPSRENCLTIFDTFSKR